MEKFSVNLLNTWIISIKDYDWCGHISAPNFNNFKVVSYKNQIFINHYT